MKNLTLIILIALHCSLFTIHSFSQSCLPEGITFTSQAQIDSFQINYPNCSEIEGNVKIYGDDINDLNGLNVITSIGGYLGLYNLSMSNLSGLNNLKYLGGDFIISDNDSLINLLGLDMLNSISGDIRISSNSSLVNLSGLENVISFEGSITIEDNDALNSLTGLDNLISIQGDIIIGNGNGVWGGAGNASLNNLNGLDNLTTIGGNLRIESNETLASLTGLENLSFIGGDLYIGHYLYGNPSLISLSGLSNLTTIEGHLHIEKNNALTSLTGLDNLTSLGGHIYIWSNTYLISLSGLDNLDASHFVDLYIENNTSLSNCEIQSICNYLGNSSGYVSIHNNAPGCSSQEEVEEACGLSIDDITIIKNLSIYPNPFSNTITIEFELEHPEIITMTIYNHLGQDVELITESKLVGHQKIEWNCKGLPAGIYFCVLKTNDPEYSGQTIKMIKL